MRALRVVGAPLALAVTLACPAAPRSSELETRVRPRPDRREEVDRALESAKRAAGKDAPNPLLGKAAPPVTVQGLKGEVISLESLRGKVVVVDLWATWCEPCVRAMPEMAALAAAHRDTGLAVLAINQGEDAETARAFVAQKKLGPPLVFGVDVDERASEALAADGLPHTVVIDHAGVIRAVHSGYSSRTHQELTREVAEALAARKRDGRAR